MKNPTCFNVLFWSFLVSVSLSQTAVAQSVGINTNGNPPDPSALLDLSSNSMGVLVPRMGTAERTSISSPAQGLLVYDTTTRSFWFFDGLWREIAGGSGGPTGPALGDLSGSYPAPTVAKIQNLDVAFGVPFDKQVLKWDALSNHWKGKNDSLFLPYNVTYSNNGAALFGITTNASANGSSAIYGKRGAAGSGITPANTMGVWGDNSTGIGIIGTSSTGIGTYGFSFSNHGASGYSTLADFAGVYGSHANANGIGILGDIQNSGKAVWGRSTATLGKAGMFSTSASEHTDTTLLIYTAGKGTLSLFQITNSLNDKPAVEIQQAGNGPGLKLRQTKTTSPASGLDIQAFGNGYGFYCKSENSTTAKIENTNATNVFPVAILSNNSTGNTLTVNSSNTGVTGNVVEITNSGQSRALSSTSAKGNAGYFAISDVNTAVSGLSVNHPGLGRGLEVSLTKSTNGQAGIWVNTTGTLGLQSSAASNNSVSVLGAAGASAHDAIGVKGTTGTNASNGIGVLGQAGSNDPAGIGVKGIAGGALSGGIGVLGEGLSSNPQAIGVKGIGYTHNEDVGAVTGINMTDGVGVFGEALGFDGIGIAGTVGNTGNHSVAAVFKNTYAENNRAVVELITNGKGNGIWLDHNSPSNTSPLFLIQNSGSGPFLRFENGLGDTKTTLSKDGNLITDGTVTVKGDKGIVRNSSSTQLRTDIKSVTIPTGSLPHYDEFNSSVTITVTFSPAFGSTPSVYLGNLVSGGLSGLTIRVFDVTTTGCNVVVSNFSPYDFSWSDTTYKLIAIGGE